jgi:hypothetical protein
MSKRFDNKKLFYILAGLLVILLLTVVVKIPKEKATLKERLVAVDTADVVKIVITPGVQKGKPFEFVKQDAKWTVRQDNVVSEPAKGAVTGIFTAILGIKPQSLAAIGEAKWTEYELTDSLATRVSLLNSRGREIAGMMIGKFTYRQVNNPYAYGGNNIEGSTYVRIPGEEKIYAVEGFLALSFNGDFNDWRDKSFLRCKKDDIIKVTFTYPDDSSFVLSKKDSNWNVNNLTADSTNTSNYLNTLASVNGQDFRDGYKPVPFPEYQLVIEGNNLLNVTVKCYSGEKEGEFILNSSLNPDVYFASSKDELFGRLFKSKSYFLKQERKGKK